MKILPILALLGSASLAACAEVPTYSTVDMMPPAGKTWQQFSQEKAYCQSQAGEQVKHEVNRRNDTGIIGGVATTVLGAGIGAAAGGGMGAALGAATGAFAGTAGGGMYSGSNSATIQSAYNTVYLQCMQTYGNMTQRPVIRYQVSPMAMQSQRYPTQYNSGMMQNQMYPSQYRGMMNMNGQTWNNSASGYPYN